jgi:hypothetical protein
MSKINFMKNILKCTTILALALLSISSYGQINFGVKAGLNVTTIGQNFDDDDLEMETRPRLLFTLGGLADISFSDMISLQPGLNFSLKGFGVDVKDEYDADKGYDRYTVGYLEIPINVALKFGGFQAFAGPYIGVGLFGKNKWDVSGDGWDDSGDADIVLVTGKATPEQMMDDELVIRRIDYGINLGAGYKLGPVLVGANLAWGLANLTPDVEDAGDYDPKDYKTTNRTISITATYFFGK